MNKMRHAFSLMEMMVVLLIVAIIAAASAPMVSKKMSRSSSGESPWVFTGLGNNIAYNMTRSDNSTAIIGAQRVPAGTRTRLFIDSGNNASHIAFGNGDIEPLELTADPANGRIGFSNDNITTGTVAFGIGQNIDDASVGGTIMGRGSRISGDSAVAIGANTRAVNHSIAIGGSSTAMFDYTIRLNYQRKVILNIWRNRSTTVVILASTQAQAEAQAIATLSGSSRNRNITATVLGTEQRFGTNASGDASIALGYFATSPAIDAVSIGNGASARAQRSIGIGRAANARTNASIAIGEWASTNASGAIAQGSRSSASGQDSIAIGVDANASGVNSVAIGTSASATADNQIVLGTEDDVVYIPGRLVVGGETFLGLNPKYRVPQLSGTRSTLYVRTAGGSNTGMLQYFEKDYYMRVGHEGYEEYANRIINGETTLSDRRLKNVGEKYTAGLAELKKLDFFNYTFKKDELKTPRVGVMAQDLQKVFPDAVIKGDDGYLRIRLEDMFYAVINAVKELDIKITALTKNITGMQTTIQAQQKQIEKQQQELAELKKELEEIKRTLKK